MNQLCQDRSLVSSYWRGYHWGSTDYSRESFGVPSDVLTFGTAAGDAATGDGASSSTAAALPRPLPLPLAAPVCQFPHEVHVDKQVFCTWQVNLISLCLSV